MAVLMIPAIIVGLGAGFGSVLFRSQGFKSENKVAKRLGKDSPIGTSNTRSGWLRKKQ
jgi:hypothetical protein